MRYRLRRNSPVGHENFPVSRGEPKHAASDLQEGCKPEIRAAPPRDVLSSKVPSAISASRSTTHPGSEPVPPLALARLCGR